MANKTITLVDNGDERYLIKTDFTTLGRRYDNESEELTVIFPEFEREAEHACTMVVTHDNTNVDRILVADGTPVPIRDNLSQYTSVTIGFVFTDSNGYIKGSEKKQFPFLPAQSPEDFVPVDPEIEDDLLFVIANALTKLGLSGNTLQGKNKAETVTTSVDLTAFKNTNIKFNDQVVEEVDANDFAAGIKMSLDTTNYKLTVNLVDGNDVVLSTQTVDLPSENAIVDASYDETTKKITFVLQSGNTFDVDVSSIVSGLVSDTRTIAGLRLNQNISASDLRTALNVEDGASSFNENNIIAGTNISVSKSGKNVTISATGIPSKTSDLINDGDGESQFATQADIGDGTITITENGETVATFSVNQTSNTTVNLTGGGGGGTSDYADLENKPSINSVTLSGNKTSSDLGLQPTISDLSTIRSNASAGKDASDTISTYGDIVTHNTSEFATSNQGAKADTSIQPNDNITSLTNNAGFITAAVDNLTNYYKKNETYTQAEVNALIGAIKTIKVEIVAELPTADATTYFNDSKTIYMVAITGSGNDYYNEYITVRSGVEGSYIYAWEKIGNTQIDLTGYVQKATTIAGVDLQDNITKSELANALGINPDLNIENGTGAGSVKLKGNTSQGDRSSALGNNNTVQADRAFASGGGNVIRYDSSNPNSVNGYMGFASGQNNYVSGWGAAAIGSQLEAKNSGQFIAGSANKYKTDTYVEVGNGTTSFINVDIKPIWNDVVNNPIYYTVFGDGYRKITQNTMTLEEYNSLTASDIYVFDDSKRSNAFEIKRNGSISLGTNPDRVFEDLKTYAIAFVINQVAPQYSINTLMAMGYDTLKTNYGTQVVQALSYQFQQVFTSCDEAIAYLINYTLGITYVDNEIKAPLSAAFGVKNVIHSLAAIANGYNNKIGKADAPQKGTASGIIGVNNEVYGENDFVVGDGNKIEDATRSATFGNGNIVKNSQGFEIHDAYGFGQGLKVEETHQTVVGRYNDNTVSQTAKLFEVGNGTADNARSNAFEVMEDGVVRAYGTPSGNNDLITKGYADSHYSGGGGGSVSIDNSSITENTSNQIQAVGVIGTNGLLGADTIDTGLTIQIYEEND